MNRRLESVRGDSGAHLTRLARGRTFSVMILSGCEPRPPSLRRVRILSGVNLENLGAFG
ncbi:hypothetical protein FH972_001838 [Carpinus fangiana]|uniref:Uncharacterized protein n=1 Tax=Carpinus fangiana TaxID=176857 RepID=A0A5N6QG60_9ROSI|nr:hypothetical protein FH972_001838 [Carpinus fangiana]